jgi:hypothetical protein
MKRDEPNHDSWKSRFLLINIVGFIEKLSIIYCQCLLGRHQMPDYGNGARYGVIIVCNYKERWILVVDYG